MRAKILSLFLAVCGYYASAQCDLEINYNGNDADFFCVGNPSVSYEYGVSRSPSHIYDEEPPCITYTIYGGQIEAVDGVAITPVDSWTNCEPVNSMWVYAPYPRVTVRWDANQGYHAIRANATQVGTVGTCGPQEAYADIFFTPTLPNAISVGHIPTCSSGSFTFSAPTAYQYDVNYQWSFPASWTATGATSGYGVTQISGNAFVNGAVAGGNVVLTMTTKGSCTAPKTIAYVVTGSAPISVSNFATSGTLDLCANNTLTVSPTISGGVSPYTYAWGTWTSGCPAQNCASITLTRGQFVPGRTLDLRVTDAANCYQDVQAMMISGDEHWISTSLYIGTGQHQPVESFVDINNVDIVSDAAGQPYYVGLDHNIWRYRYVPSPSGWVNEALTSTADASGELAVYEPTPGSPTIIYKSTNGSIKKLVGTTITQLTPTGACAVGVVAVDNNGVIIYKNPQGGLSKTTVSGTPIIDILTSGVAGTNIAVSTTYTRVYYVNSVTGTISCVNYSTKADVPVGNQFGLTNLTVLPNTDLTLNQSNNAVFFVHSSGQIAYIPFNTNQYWPPIAATAPYPSNGTISFNKTSGVLYYKGTNNLFYQLFYTTTAGWAVNQLLKPNQLADVSQDGDIKFANPNLFYVNVNGYVRTVQYPTNQCNPSILRQAEPAAATIADPTASTGVDASLMISPNPAQGSASVQYTITEEGEAYLHVYDLSGREIQKVAAHGKAFAASTEMLDLSNVQPGMYVLQLTVNGQRVSSTRFAVR